MHSRRALATHRSAIAFARGACTGVLMICRPTAVNTASNAAVNLASRSRIKNFRPVGFNYYVKGLSWDAVRSSLIGTA